MCGQFGYATLYRLHWTILGDFEEETVISSGCILDYSSYYSSSPTPKLASELHWPVHPDLDTSPLAFSLVYLKMPL